uniref:Uncharacterized protein n=1 Tax=Ananas comosus var. bracteatus TaxID=296719 RepID=A0A6V7NSG2_ANACO|nr:unnamed protein product [Ananas comosus var. bracteatus]
MGNCSSNNTVSCNPPEIDITEVYAPNCGVELPTLDTIPAVSWRVSRSIFKQRKHSQPFFSGTREHSLFSTAKSIQKSEWGLTERIMGHSSGVFCLAAGELTRLSYSKVEAGLHREAAVLAERMFSAVQEQSSC